MTDISVSLVIFVSLLLVAIIFSVANNKLTGTGVAVAVALSIIIFYGTGLNGVVFLGSFFILGIFATAWNRKKQHIRINKESEQRDALQVLANGGLAAILSQLALFFPEYSAVFLLMIACAFSSATADTLSSELGTVYGKNFYNITTFKKDRNGEDGVISFEGTFIGIIGSLVIAMVYLTMVEFSLSALVVIVVSGTLGNLSDSLLGATLERQNIIGNNAVNFLNTFIAAAIGGALSY